MRCRDTIAKGLMSADHFRDTECTDRRTSYAKSSRYARDGAAKRSGREIF